MNNRLIDYNSINPMQSAKSDRMNISAIGRS